MTVAPSVTELVFALGAGDFVVGVSRYDDYPSSVRSLPRVGGFLDPNVEAILALRPDLVVGVPNAGNRPALERLAGLGVPVFVVPGNSFPDVFHSIRAVGAVFGGVEAERATKLCDRIQRELEELSGRVHPSEPRPRVAVVYGTRPLVLGGRGSFADTLVEAFGGRNVAGEGAVYPEYDPEGFIAAAPDVIIEATGAHGAVNAAFDWSRFSMTPAVRFGRVYRLNLDGLLRPSPRLVPAMRALFEAIHPPAPSGSTRRESLHGESPQGADLGGADR